MKRIDEWADEACEAMCQDSKRGTPKVYKSNMLNEAYYKLTLVEHRSLLCLIADLNPFDAVPEALTLKATDYANIYGTPLKQAYQALQNATEHLHERTLEIDGEVIPWLAGPVDYDFGEAEIKFSDGIKPHLHHFTGNFTRYELERVVPLQSTHSIRLYELCAQQSSGELHISVDQFRKRLGLEGRYKEFFSLRADVIEPAIKELREKSGLIIKQYEVKRRHRKAVGFTFRFKEKSLPGSNLVRLPRQKALPTSSSDPEAEATRQG